MSRFDATRYARGNVTVAELRERMQCAMQKYCSVFRMRDLLQMGCREISRLHLCNLQNVNVRIEVFYWSDSKCLSCENTLPDLIALWMQKFASYCMYKVKI